MERIYDEYDEEGLANIDNLRDNFTKEELVELCSGFARENMKLIRWLYKNHRKILRDYENKYCNGQHIQFAE
jgi:hypothetical protein